jgi:hypothetical protein
VRPVARYGCGRPSKPAPVCPPRAGRTADTAGRRTTSRLVMALSIPAPAAVMNASTMGPSRSPTEVQTMAKAAGTLLLACLWLVGTPPDAAACSCSPPGPADVALDILHCGACSSQLAQP